MTIPTSDLQKDGSVNRQRNAFRAAVILLVAISFNFILSLRLGFQSGAWQNFARGGAVAIFGAITIHSLQLIRRNRVETGIWRIIGSFLITMLITASLMADFGIILGLIEFLIVSIIAVYTLPPKQIGRAIALSSVGAVLTVGVDALNPAFSLPAPETFRQALPVLAAIVILINVVLILRQFMSFPLQGKLITVLVGVTAVSIAIVGGFSLYILNTDLRHQITINQTHTAETKEAAVQVFLANARSDVLFLSQARAMREYLQATSSGNTDDIAKAITTLETGLSDFAEKHPIYDQIRFLNVAGQEIVRVNLTPDGSYAASRDNLQNKADRYYFQNSIDLASGEVYISPLDLNVEQGQIEMPHKPTLRFSTPMYAGNKVVGVVVTNVLAEKFLEPLGSGEATALLVDADGYYLYHPDTNKRFGRDLGTDYTVSQDYPELVTGLFSGEIGTHETEDQLFAYTSITFPGESAPRWYLASFRSVKELFAPVTQAQNTVLLMLGGAILAASIVATFVSQLLAKPLLLVTRAAESVAEGDWSTRVAVDRQDEIGTLAHAFNVMSDHMQDSVNLLEARVAERTQELAASAEALAITAKVSRRLSTILDVEELVTAVVELVQDAFDYYHAHIYLLDETGNTLLMTGGTGEVGRQMLAQGHRIPVGKGLVGRAAQTHTAVLVPDISQEEDWLPNPLLPDTKAEAAVSIAAGDQILGVLDVQHNVVNGLRQLDAEMLQSIAGQVAISLQNARSLEQVKRQAQHEMTINEINQRISSTTNMQEAMQVAVRELGRATGAPQTSVQLITPDKNGRTQHNA